ncbi:MAG: SGNH/GDSL hydrolase family protein [Methylocystis sp.]|nr:SGNH/GDSL hydrolase family protein [Methylocystis sp.]
MFPGAQRLAFVLAVTGGLTLLSLKRSDEPTLSCATVNGGSNEYKVLIVGESWASYGKILPELPRAVSKRLQGRGVTACSIGFAGRNSRLLYSELREKFPTEKLYRLFDGKKPDTVVLMNGVNDEIQHVGASAYVEYTKKLVEYFSDVDDVQIIAIPRVNERRFKPPTLYSAVKRRILSCFYDQCQQQVNDLYRVALWRDHPELTTIEYDDFIDRYEGNERRYTADGVHLTDEYFHKYGEFIGGALSLRKDAAK